LVRSLKGIFCNAIGRLFKAKRASIDFQVMIFYYIFLCEDIPLYF
ncbi:hypothetical protein HMPREF9148_02908, partial [Prevotella sp. F0091]